MVGFIKGILGAKQTAKTEATPAPDVMPKPKAEPKPKAAPKAQAAPKPPAAPKQAKQKPEAFYLDSSDARTLGDIDYMQTAREVRRSFPKTLGGEELRTVSVVSSLQRSAAQKAQAIAQQASLKITPSSTFASQSTPVSGWTTPKADAPPTISDPKERRRKDSNLDTFRSMARDLQKGRARSY
ncbi:MAG: hypothetical protein KME27_13690 [Lyngbya sp. HA4199-MV5]|jgi:outer membrane biosynthesis protein TonB|nr:hypothetical protein [Lyngbya sp. HA4199-MV5]